MMRGLPPGLAQAMGGFMMEDEEEALPVFPMREAQREMLAELVLATSTARRFKKGDPVHYRGPVGPQKQEVIDALVMVFWRYLVADDGEDQVRVDQAHESVLMTLPYVDCLVAYYDGQKVKFHLSCSAMLTEEDA